MANVYCRYPDYYGDNPARELAHRMQENDPVAITKIARDLADMINGDCGLIPVPGRNGLAVATLSLTGWIQSWARCQKKVTAEVLPILTGTPRNSLYDYKKEGKNLSEFDFGFRLCAPVPEGKRIYLVDNVLATGLTAYAASKLVPSADILVHSIDNKTFQESAYRKEFGKILTLNPVLLRHKQKHNLGRL